MLSRDKVMQKAAAAQGNGTVMEVKGLANMAMQVTGTFSGTITFEATVDNTNWVSIQVVNIADGTVSTTATAAGIYQCGVAGLTKVRARVSAWASGTITVRGFVVEAASGLTFADIDVQGSESVTITGSLPAGTNNIGDVDIASALPAGTNNIGDVDVLTIAAGSNTIGGTTDEGPGWTSAYTYTTSADMSSAADITAAPTGSQKLVITDIILSSDTQMLFVFKEETSGNTIGAVRLPADGTVQLTPRTAWKLPTADRKLQGDASAAGNVYVTVFYHSEA